MTKAGEEVISTLLVDALALMKKAQDKRLEALGAALEQRIADLEHLQRLEPGKAFNSATRDLPDISDLVQ